MMAKNEVVTSGSLMSLPRFDSHLIFVFHLCTCMDSFRFEHRQTESAQFS